MKLSNESYELAKARQRERMAQYELPNMPEPMTRNRARDFNHLTNGCTHCGVLCDYCYDPLGR